MERKYELFSNYRKMAILRKKSKSYKIKNVKLLWKNLVTCSNTGPPYTDILNKVPATLTSSFGNY